MNAELILKFCDENSPFKIFYENEEDSLIVNVENSLEEHNLTEEDFLNVLNENTVLNSSNTELFIKLANFFHKYEIKEQVLLDCIYEPFSKDVLDKLPKHAFNQAYLDKDCSEKELIESFRQESCFGIFKYHWDNENIQNFDILNTLVTLNLKYLKYAHNNNFYFGLWTCEAAAENGNLDCLKYAYDIYCKTHSGCLNIFDNLCSYAAKNGHLDCLKYLHEKGHNISQFTCFEAVKNGHLNCLKYLHKNNCPLNDFTCEHAAANGQLECLKYLHENKCIWNKFTCVYAAVNGHLNCLKYAHENDCPWVEETCSCAAANGHLDCLKYAAENGCPWNNLTCANAAANGQLDCLKYAHEHGCPWNEDTCTRAAENGQLDCLKYAIENGCPCDK